MIRRLIAILAVILLAFAASPSAIAQNFGMSGSRGGGIGMSGFGSSAFGSGGMGGMGFGGFGNSGFGGGGFGNSGFGGSGFGNAGFGGGGGFGNMGFGGNSGFGNTGFGNSSGYGNAGGQNFIGRDPGDIQATFGQLGRTATQFMNNMNRNMNRGNNGSRRSTSNRQTVQNVAQPMRVEVKVGFTPPRPTSDQMATVIRTRLTKLLADRKMSPATFTMEGDTAVVGGVAASENERAVIGQLLAIEPGIGTVRNEMTLAQPASAAGPAGAASETAPPPEN